MKRGLKLTLMTVAFALVSVQAMAVAPTIGDVPSPVVGSFEPMTNSNRYVYETPIDLNTLASDPETTDASKLMWTFTGGTAAAPSHYTINGIDATPTDSWTLDGATSPTITKIINQYQNPRETWNTDGKVSTITIRNKSLSPFASTTDNDTGIANGVITAETAPITFFVSDGNAVSSKTVLFYTDKGGHDRLSQSVTTVKDYKMAGNPAAQFWGSTDGPWAAGTITSNTQFNGSFCLNAPLTGANVGTIASPYQYFDLTANQVYRIKVTMNSTQATAGNVPLFDFIVENTNTRGTQGRNYYITDYLIYDNRGLGGANAFNSGEKQFVIYFAPPAVTTPQWNAGAFTPGHANDIHPRIKFRILDVDNVGFGELKSGALCLSEVVVQAIPVSSATVVKNLVNISSLVLANSGGTGNVQVTEYDGSTVATTFNGGVMSIQESGTFNQAALAEIRPASDLTYGVTPGGASVADNWPIPWESGKILRMQVGMSAPNANSETHPYDGYMFSLQGLSSEVLLDHIMTSHDGIGAPKQGTPQTYTVFFNTFGKTTSANYGFMRWTIRFANVQAVRFPSDTSADDLNTGGVSVHNIKIDEVTLPGN
jgi:hypothetical protein